jgi:uncharacterized alpha-E superfamily protein
MMLARVADSLYWMGRYLERAEHLSRLSLVMLNATLDATDAAVHTGWIALTALGDPEAAQNKNAYEAARALVLDRENSDSVIAAVALARENARQVRDQMTTESWERLNLLYLRLTSRGAERQFDDGSAAFLQEVIADLHLFKGAADSTMSHGEGWRFLSLGIYLERAQLIARLLEVCFGATRSEQITDHIALMGLLRMACALEPYLRAYTAEIEPRHILEFLLFDEDFPRSIRFCTARIKEHLSELTGEADLFGQAAAPKRLAGRLNARLEFADVDAMLDGAGASALLATVTAECVDIHGAVYEAFVAYPLELRLPA